jgi:prepilin-type N-terminal cleavage/methylation domain-containing protein
MTKSAAAAVPSSRSAQSGFTLVEMIVVTLLLLIAMVGLLAVFDASARINKNETDVADAQGSVRFGIYQMTRAIRMAGVGGLYVTQAILNHNDRELSGIAPAGASYDNVAGNVTVTDTTGKVWPVRPGTDMIEVRGVLYSPLIGFVEEAGCAPCVGTQPLVAKPITGNAIVGQFLNNDPTIRPQFAAIDAYTAGATNAKPMLVIVQDATGELHTCGDPGPPIGIQRYPQAPYNVGTIDRGTDLVGTNSFGNVDFGGTIGPRFNIELPSLTPGKDAEPLSKIKRAGILDDVVFFITTDVASDPTRVHPFLAQGIRRGNAFEVTRLADDVEDMQIAYGIDGDGDGSVTRSSTGGCDPAGNPDDGDPTFSQTAGCDEWTPNAVGEAPVDDAQFQQQDPFNPAHQFGSSPHCPRLHAVMISLLAKARDSDPTYLGPAAAGYKTMNSTAAPVSPGTFRRRIQTLKINLRNFAYQG